MQKIMFEHRRFGLEQAVIARLKENTRRRVRFPKGINDKDVESAVMGVDRKGRVYFTFSVATDQGAETVDVYPKYQIGERVAIAQSYEIILGEHDLPRLQEPIDEICYDGLHNAYRNPIAIRAMMNGNAYNNKLFVRADLMPHVIEITDIKAERLQDISDEDCLREGIHVHNPDHSEPRFIGYAYDATPGTNRKRWWFHTPRKAFAALIDALNGRGTWERNEWQFAYIFKLIK